MPACDDLRACACSCSTPKISERSGNSSRAPSAGEFPADAMANLGAPRLTNRIQDARSRAMQTTSLPLPKVIFDVHRRRLLNHFSDNVLLVGGDHADGDAAVSIGNEFDFLCVHVEGDPQHVAGEGHQFLKPHAGKPAHLLLLPVARLTDRAHPARDSGYGVKASLAWLMLSNELSRALCKLSVSMFMSLSFGVWAFWASIRVRAAPGSRSALPLDFDSAVASSASLPSAFGFVLALDLGFDLTPGSGSPHLCVFALIKFPLGDAISLPQNAVLQETKADVNRHPEVLKMRRLTLQRVSRPKARLPFI